MTNVKSTKKALIASILSLCMCFSMLLGTTFAWFTDSVTSANNVITAGNLDVELEYWKDGKWNDVKDASDILTNELWEPGATEVVYLKLSNKGTLDFKYQLAVNIDSETPGINQKGEVFFLSDYIRFGVNVVEKENVYADRDAAIKAIADSEKIISAGYTKSDKLDDGKSVYLAMVVYMPETVGNEANYGDVKPEINLGINVFATQATSESDSFGADYDKGADWTGIADTEWYNTTDIEFTLTTSEQLAGLAEIVNAGKDTFEGKTVKLGADIDLNKMNWTPIGNSTNKFKGKFIGTGYTISNLRAVGSKHVGLFGATYVGAHIEGVTIENAYVSGNDYVGAVVGGGYLAANCIKNCTVTNATIIATPYYDSDKGVYDGGAKAGVIVGQAYNGSLIGNTVKNSTVTAYRDLGGIAGMLDFDGKNGTVEASGNTVEKVTLNYLGVAGAYADGKVNENMAEVVGRVGAKATVGTNTTTNVTTNEDNKGATMIFTLEELIAFAKAVNAGNTYAGETVILGADIDLLNMEWTPIGTGAGFKGTFDGNGKTISNLKITGNKSTVGLFANTYNGEIRNLTVKNALVSGRLNVGVVAGNPYTSKYTDITVEGHVEVNGMAYVGGVGGKNAYADWTNITVDVDETSYVKANSVENGTAYRTYVGGVVGFNGEGGHTFKNITTNIDVIGDVCDIGGAFGIAHYGNKFENVTVTGNVESLGEADEIGGIAGVWNNATGYTVEFIDCKFEGDISDNNGAVTGCDIVGGKYSTSGEGVLKIVNYFDENGFIYCEDGITGDKAIVKIPSDAPEKIEIPEGVTILGSKILEGNTTVKEVVIPSTVTNFGGTPNATGTGASGGMFYKSAVEKVVLPEGIKEIPAAAFNQATNLKEVNIPSTVTTIGINAFAGSGLATLELSNNIEEIGYGAFRDMDKLTTVTIEGDVHIPTYAFRSCSNLTSIYLKGANVTFGVGQVITDADHNNYPNGTTVYVANPAVKARLEANGQFKGTIVCEIEVGEDGMWKDANGNDCTYASNDTTLDTAISKGAETVYLSSGNYIIPDSAQGKTLTIIGNGDTVVATQDDGSYEGCDYSLDGATVTFEGVVINTDSTTYTGYARCKGTYNNCTINGSYTLYGESEFNNCTFNVTGDYYNIWTWGAKTVKFNGCTFNTDGKSILVYNQTCDVYVDGCTFNDRTNGTGFTKSAFETGVDGVGPKYNIYISNTTVNGFAENDKCVGYKNIVGNKNSMTNEYLNIVVDGVDVY